MSFPHAGFWIDSLTDTKGNALPITVFVLTDPANGNAPVTIYTDASKTSTIDTTGSPLHTDAWGNASFFADPGVYTLTVPSTGRCFPSQLASQPQIST